MRRSSTCGHARHGHLHGARGRADGEEWLLGEPSLEKRQEVARAIGRRVGELHDAGIVHGDLTTSNMIVREARGGKSGGGSGSIALIDFGLGAHGQEPGGQGRGPYVLERALASMHANSDTELMPHVLAAYREASDKKHFQVMQKLDQVGRRGRKRLAFG